MTTETNWPEGTRYSDAHLGKIDFPKADSEKLQEWQKKQMNMMILISNPGVGKTYFCAALANFFKGKTQVHYMKDRDFFDRLRKNIDTYSYELSKMAGYAGIWILDDIGATQLTDWQKEVLTSFVDERYENKLPLIITSNVWLKDMPRVFTERFASRLSAKENTVIEMYGESKRLEGL